MPPLEEDLLPVKEKDYLLEMGIFFCHKRQILFLHRRTIFFMDKTKISPYKKKLSFLHKEILTMKGH